MKNFVVLAVPMPHCLKWTDVGTHLLLLPTVEVSRATSDGEERITPPGPLSVTKIKSLSLKILKLLAVISLLAAREICQGSRILEAADEANGIPPKDYSRKSIDSKPRPTPGRRGVASLLSTNRGWFKICRWGFEKGRRIPG